MDDTSTNQAAANDGAAFAPARVPLGGAVTGLLRAWSELFAAEVAVAHGSLDSHSVCSPRP